MLPMSVKWSMNDKLLLVKKIGNCEEQLPSTDCRPTVGRLLADCRPVWYGMSVGMAFIRCHFLA